MLSFFREEVRIAPALEWLPPESLPREAKKTRYIEVVKG